MKCQPILLYGVAACFLAGCAAAPTTVTMNLDPSLKIASVQADVITVTKDNKAEVGSITASSYWHDPSVRQKFHAANFRFGSGAKSTQSYTSQGDLVVLVDLPGTSNDAARRKDLSGGKTTLLITRDGITP